MTATKKLIAATLATAFAVPVLAQSTNGTGPGVTSIPANSATTNVNNYSNTNGGSNSNYAVKIPDPIIRKERYNLGPCDGPAFQAIWKEVTTQAYFDEIKGSRLRAITADSLTIRHETDSIRKAPERAVAAEYLAQKHGLPVPAITASIHGPHTQSTTYPQRFTDVTYSCK